MAAHDLAPDPELRRIAQALRALREKTDEALQAAYAAEHLGASAAGGLDGLLRDLKRRGGGATTLVAEVQSAWAEVAAATKSAERARARAYASLLILERVLSPLAPGRREPPGRGGTL